MRWKNGDQSAAGFNIYRDGKRMNDKLIAQTATSFTEKHSGTSSYSVSGVGLSGQESPLSVPSRCEAGSADMQAPHIVVVSPPTSSPVDQPIWVKARMLDNRSYDNISATLHYRTIGEKKWKTIAMERKVKAIFAAGIPASDVPEKGLEYYIEANDGSQSSLFPASSPETPFSVITFAVERSAKSCTPPSINAKHQSLTWKPSGDGVYWYRIYRSDKPDFKASPASYVTFVAAGTTSFKDNGEGLDGVRLKGDWYYRVTAVGKSGNESAATGPIRILY